MALSDCAPSHQSTQHGIPKVEKSETKEASSAMNTGNRSATGASTHIDALPTRRILPLSPEAVSQIRSSRHITSLQEVIARLLENSLDAGATRVDISVDWKRGACLVSDNGVGIPCSEFAEDGGLGRMYYTSKRTSALEASSDIPTHGLNGTFLAELAAMSLLDIQSTYVDKREAAILTIHHSKIIARRLTADEPSHFASLRSYSGTTVDVRDLFGNMPVRVKQRALQSEIGAESDKAWSDLKRAIVSLLLSWPHTCAVKLRDSNSDARVVNLSNSTSSDLTEKRLGQLSGRGTKFDLRDALPLLFQSGLATYESRSRWVPVSASTSAVSLKGLICLDPAPTKQCQFVAIGLIPCVAAAGRSELYDAVNKVFAQSSFGAIEARADPDGRRNSASNGNQKSVDRHAMYVLQLTLKDLQDAHVIDVDKLSEASVKILTDVLEAAVTAWLDSNLFRPKKRRKHRVSSDRAAVSRVRPSSETSLSRDHSENAGGSRIAGTDLERRAESRSRTGRSIALSTDFRFRSPPGRLADLGGVGGMRSGRPQSCGQAFAQKAGIGSMPASPISVSAKATTDLSSRPKVFQAPFIAAGHYNMPSVAPSSPREPVPPQHPSSEDFGNVDDADLLLAEHSAPHSSTDRASYWKDPVTGEEFQVNTRTGIMLPFKGHRIAENEPDRKVITPRQSAAMDTTLSSAGLPISLSRRRMLLERQSNKESSDSEAWLPGFLKDWTNPVFAKQREEPIPTASLAGPGLLELAEQRKCCSGDKYSPAFAYHGGVLDEGTRLSKLALTQANVIAQVDQKFVLIRMPLAAEGKLGSSSTLVLIDQHAASERVILETLLTEMCTSIPGDPALQSSSLVHETSRGKNLTFEISSKEHELFVRYHQHFAHWGILYDTPSATLSSKLGSHSNAGKQQYRIIVTHLPSPIAERCANFPALAIEMLRAEVWALEDGTKKAIHTAAKTTTTSTQGRDEASWLSLLPLMPSHLLTMLHSRACRSAIMFNDVLSIEQCQELVDKLGKCIFPFVCAHGRVAMVPVMDLGSNAGHAARDSGEEAEEREGIWEDRGQRCDVEALRAMMSGSNTQA